MVHIAWSVVLGPKCSLPLPCAVWHAHSFQRADSIVWTAVTSPPFLLLSPPHHSCSPLTQRSSVLPIAAAPSRRQGPQPSLPVAAKVHSPPSHCSHSSPGQSPPRSTAIPITVASAKQKKKSVSKKVYVDAPVPPVPNAPAAPPAAALPGGGGAAEPLAPAPPPVEDITSPALQLSLPWHIVRF